MLSMITCAISAYLRAKEDYLMGINFSRLLTLKYGLAHFTTFRITKCDGRFRGPCHDLCAGHGGAQGTGDPGICERLHFTGCSGDFRRCRAAGFEGEWRAVDGFCLL